MIFIIKSGLIILSLFTHMSYVSDKPLSGVNNVESVSCLANSDIDYLKEISNKNEFLSGEFKVSKWNKDVKISVTGNYTDKDIEEINIIIKELNDLINDDINITFTDDYSESNMKVYFIKESEYRNYFYNPPHGVNWGIFEFYKNKDYSINRANVAIDYSVTNQNQRNHLLREEITQSLGLMNDSYKFYDSIFYGNWSETSYYNELDKKIISHYYSNSIKPGMSSKDIESTVCLNNKL